MKRRDFIQGMAAPGQPQQQSGIQIGDVLANSALVWGRSDRPARMWVEWSTDPDFVKAQRMRGPWALSSSDFTSRLELTGLWRGYKVRTA